MRVVFDTNVLVAAFLTEGICAKLLRRARRREFDLLWFPCLLDEFGKVLKSKFSAAPTEIEESLEIIREAGSSAADPKAPVRGVCRDPHDDLILSCAQAAGADFIVTGDADLIVLGRFEQTMIVTPRDFEMLFPL